jgi:hypothetical protein
VAAHNNLQLAKAAAMRDEHKSCIDEKKAVDRARQRQELCDEKIRLVKHWRIKLRHQTQEFHGKLARLRHQTEVDLPRALAVLDRILRALDKYSERQVAAAPPVRYEITDPPPAEPAPPAERPTGDEDL